MEEFTTVRSHLIVTSRIRDSERMLARWIGVLTGSWFALLFLFYALAT